MRRRRVVFFLFVVFVAAAAIFVTATSAPAPRVDPGFSSPTLTLTATITPEPSPTGPIQFSGDPIPESAANCTYTFEAWRQYPEAWGLALIRIGSQTYSQPEVLELFARPDPDTQTQLLQQLFTAVINQRAGADPNAIIATLAAASDWLDQHPPASELSAEDQAAGQELAGVLEDYNQGEIGPGACTRPIETPTPTLSPTPQDTLTPTVTYTPLTPVATPTNTRRPPGPPPGFRSPTPSRTPDDNAPPPATWTPVPRDTDPPPPTDTQPPAPTNTQPPPPTNTQPPAPTDTQFPNPTDAPTGAP